MLAADKLSLQSALKQQATALKEKEFNLHHSNLMTVGTQAAVLAALDCTMFIEFQPTNHYDSKDVDSNYAVFLKAISFIYYISIVTAFCSNITVVSHTTVLSVLGTSLGLRGPDGSMIVATEGVYKERLLIFQTFGRGLLCTVLSAAFAGILSQPWEISVGCFIICMVTLRSLKRFYDRVKTTFEFDEDTQAIDLEDIFATPQSVARLTAEQLQFAVSRAQSMRDTVSSSLGNNGNVVGGGSGSGGSRNNNNNNHHHLNLNSIREESERGYFGGLFFGRGRGEGEVRARGGVKEKEEEEHGLLSV